MLAAIIQARMGSTRLPEKTFADICGHPLIEHVVDRLRPSKSIEKIVVATTVNSKDDILAQWCKQKDLLCFRGSETDVLSRYHQAALAAGASEVVRVTADDPCKDWRVIDAVIDMFRKQSLDFAYNNKPPSFPEGLDTEVFTLDALTRAVQGIPDGYEREHVTQYMYRRPESFRQENLAYRRDVSHIRLTIDVAEDLQFVREIYARLYSHQAPPFSLEELLTLLETNPSLSKINSEVGRSAMYKQRSASNAAND